MRGYGWAFRGITPLCMAWTGLILAGSCGEAHGYSVLEDEG